MKEYYCVRKMRDPDTNPGYLPCPDYELHGCAGCKELENKEGEINMIANVVNGEVGGICGTVTIYYASGETVEADGQTLRRIHARVVDNQVRHELFPDSLRYRQ